MVDKIQKKINEIKPVDLKLIEDAQKRLDNLTKPQGSLGRLEEFARRIVAITGKQNPCFKRRVIFTLAADHGVAEEGVSAFPQEVTAQMVYNFLQCGAGINVLARHSGCEVIVVDMGIKEKLQITNYPDGKIGIPTNRRDKLQNFKDKKVNLGTKNFTKGKAMTKEEAIKSITNGIEVFEDEFNKIPIDIVGLGDMGIANTTPSSAIIACITKSDIKNVTSRGTGIDDSCLKKKIEVIQRGIEINKPNPEDAIDVLTKIGGFEIGGICGCVLAAAARRVPIVIDGLISTAGALLAYKLSPLISDYIFASHNSVEIGHKVALDYIKQSPILDLNLRLGEGTGAALAINMIEAGVKILNEMATFENAGVSEKK